MLRGARGAGAARSGESGDPPEQTMIIQIANTGRNIKHDNNNDNGNDNTNNKITILMVIKQTTSGRGARGALDARAAGRRRAARSGEAGDRDD